MDLLSNLEERNLLNLKKMVECKTYLDWRAMFVFPCELVDDSKNCIFVLYESFCKCINELEKSQC